MKRLLKSPLAVVSLERCAGEASVKPSIGACHVMRDTFRQVYAQRRSRDGRAKQARSRPFASPDSAMVQTQNAVGEIASESSDAREESKLARTT